MPAIRREKSGRGLLIRQIAPSLFSNNSASDAAGRHRAHLSMRSRLFISAAMLIGMELAIGASGPLRAQGGSPSAALRDSGTQNDTTADNGIEQSYNLEVGDRVKITIYGRDDLTGQYTINEIGKVRVPTLGAFEASERSPMTLEDEIDAAVERSMQRKTDVVVDVVERRPVFVTGLVAKPGSYSYSRGMTVIQAMALAGGTLSSASTPWLPTEALREMARLRTSDLEYKRLVARQARLLAEKEDRSEIDQPQQLVEMVGIKEAAHLIGDEQRYYNSQRDSLQSQVNSLVDSINQAKLETDSYVKELDSLSDQWQIRKTMLEAIQHLAKTGLTTQQRLTDTEILVAMVERDQRQTAANVARSRQNVSKLERELATLTLDRKMQLEKELQSVDDQLANLQTDMQGSTKIIHMVGGLPAALLSRNGEPQYHYEILRKSNSNGLVTIAADETSTLLPGDVVRVSAEQTMYGIEADDDKQIMKISNQLGSFNQKE